MADTKEIHAQRIKKELQAAGMTPFGLRKFATRYLPRLIAQDEHVHGVIYGRYSAGDGLLKYSEGMLVATNQRIIFIDHKPGFTSTDEVAYSVVSGINKTSGGLLDAVTLHTRAGNYTLRYANKRCIKTFILYVESELIKQNKTAPKKQPEEILASAQPSDRATELSPEIVRFLRLHNVAVLSTLDDQDHVHGAAVRYLIDEFSQMYILTKNDGQKLRDIRTHHQVALTVFDANKPTSVQLQGSADTETNPLLRQATWTGIMQLHGASHDPATMPPAQMPEEQYTVMRITPSNARFRDYS